MTNQALFTRYQEGLIKTLLADSKALIPVSKYIESEDFGDPNYQLIYDTMNDLRKEDRNISLPDIVQYIGENNKEVNLDPEWIFSLNQDITKWILEAPAATWAKLLKKESSRHKIKTQLDKAQMALAKGDPVELINELKSEMDVIAINAMEDNEETQDEVVDRYEQHMDTRLDFAQNVIPSPYPAVNKYAIGWLQGQLITVGARTSVGKSVIACQSMLTAAMAGKTVQMFSLEMSEFEVMDRIVSSMSMVDLSAIRTRPLMEKERERFSEALATYRKLNIKIDETPSVTIDYIRNKALRQAQSDTGLDMIIIDYLQLITNNKKASRQEQVAEISREMKILAKQLQVPIMVLVQLNRESKDDPADRLPQISDIRESGAIAQDSDIILLIHRKLEADEIDPKALFILGKNRNGQPGKKISVRCALEYAMFIDNSDEYNSDHEEGQSGEQLQEAVFSSAPEYDNSNLEESIVTSSAKAEEEFFTDSDFDFSNDDEDIFGGGDF